jgi:hypothetical protein
MDADEEVFVRIGVNLSDPGDGLAGEWGEEFAVLFLPRKLIRFLCHVGFSHPSTVSWRRRVIIQSFLSIMA